MVVIIVKWRGGGGERIGGGDRGNQMQYIHTQRSSKHCAG